MFIFCYIYIYRKKKRKEGRNVKKKRKNLKKERRKDTKKAKNAELKCVPSMVMAIRENQLPAVTIRLLAPSLRLQSKSLKRRRMTDVSLPKSNQITIST